MISEMSSKSPAQSQIVRPIVYGNTARYFPAKRESDGHTHEWTLFVKPYFDEDPTRWIRRVTFKLHESIPNSTRTIDKPPYEVGESGWGEFEASIKIHFVDGAEKPVQAYHFIRLFNTDPRVMSGEFPAVYEYYDEVNERTLTIVDEAHATIKCEMERARSALKAMADVLVTRGEEYDDLVEQPTAKVEPSQS